MNEDILFGVVQPTILPRSSTRCAYPYAFCMTMIDDRTGRIYCYFHQRKIRERIFEESEPVRRTRSARGV